MTAAGYSPGLAVVAGRRGRQLTIDHPLLPSCAAMRVVAIVIAAILGVFGIGLILGSAIRGELGPLELVVALIPLGLAVLLVQSVRPSAPTAPAKVCPDCRASVPHDARVCRHCGYEFWPPEGDGTGRPPVP